MTGKSVFGQDDQLFLLDRSLSLLVAKALRKVEYNFRAHDEVFDEHNTPDPTIIDWCKENAAVWVHADERAKRQHRSALQTSGIKTLVVHRPPTGMSAKELLRILTFALPQLDERWRKDPSVRHYKVQAANSTSTPRLSKLRVR